MNKIKITKLEPSLHFTLLVFSLLYRFTQAVSFFFCLFLLESVTHLEFWMNILIALTRLRFVSADLLPEGVN